MDARNTTERATCGVIVATVWAMVAVAPIGRASTPAPLPRKELNIVLTNALNFVRSKQNEDGSFGSAHQPHLQTSFAVLAILSLASRPSAEDVGRLEKAVGYLVKTGARGNLGDDVFATESQAVATTALICGHQRIRDPELRASALKALAQALRRLRRLQDRSSAGASRGGWKMEGSKGRRNDRRASAWALLCYDTARRYGIEIDQGKLDRGTRFLLGSFKRTLGEHEHPDLLGGLSVDEEGLPVALVSSMGGWALARLQTNKEDRQKNLGWLDRHPVPWAGPNYFYANFFRVRALKFADASRSLYRRSLRRLYLQIKENQLGDGQVSFPPGNAQNTIAMGPVFSTSLAILILNIDSGRLIFDEDYRVTPLF